MPASRALFLGREVDPRDGATGAARLDFDPDDLTTHGLIVGMTGSGKTALGIILIEELLRRGVSVLAIDPKGDLGNLLLAFPSLSASEFAPWVPPVPGATAEGEAKKWTDGLASWGLSAADVATLSASRDALILTPGSTSGTPVDLFGSLAAPAAGADEEEKRELVTSYLVGLLGLVGIDADPVKSRDVVLLARCVEEIWAKGQAASLEALIATAAAPPFATVGVLPLESFYPQKERQELVLALNNLLASPSAAAFRAGAPLDVGALLAPAGGKARLTVVAIAHLSDAERSFVVATLLSRVKAWMRTQPGSPSLRALVYVDEIFGFFPPSAEPPAKKPLLTLLKQARAFGLGVVVATQNPVDLDYKGLANCGCWFVGTLQTERDRERLADGLVSASGSDAALALLPKTRKRVFLLHDVHRKAPTLFETRWAMSYLRGPMTREEIARATKTLAAPAAVAATAPAAASDASTAAPPLPPGWSATWLDKRGGEIANPYLAVRYAVRYRKDGVAAPETVATRLFSLDASGAGEVLENDPIEASVDDVKPSAPARSLRYGALPAWLGGAGAKALEKSVRERLPDKLAASLLFDPVTKSLGAPGESPEAFAARVASAGAVPAAVAEKLEKKRRDLAAAESQEKARSMETLATAAGAAVDFLGGLLGKRKSVRLGKVGSVLSKRRMEGAAESKLDALRAEIEELEAKVAPPDASRFQTVSVVPLKAHVDLLSVGVVWVT